MEEQRQSAHPKSQHIIAMCVISNVFSSLYRFSLMLIQFRNENFGPVHALRYR